MDRIRGPFAGHRKVCLSGQIDLQATKIPQQFSKKGSLSAREKVERKTNQSIGKQRASKIATKWQPANKG